METKKKKCMHLFKINVLHKKNFFKNSNVNDLFRFNIFLL